MALQQDSIVHSSVGAQGDSAAAPKHTTLTPAMVLSWLPRDATPAQQDSAIQAHFKPGPIRWSQRPDTLHLPGHGKGHNMLDVELPQYYKEGFFSRDTLFHPELPGGRYGVAGDPVPYSVHSDNTITLLLLVIFIMAVILLSGARNFLARQAKTFLYGHYDGGADITETGSEVRFQLFFVLLTSLLLSLFFYFYTLQYYGDTFILRSQYYLITIYLAMSTAYFLLKAACYTIVNNVFFDGKRNQQWLKSLLFIITLEGMLSFPLIILWAYFGLSTQTVAIYFTGVLVIVKILTFYKTYVIFFRRNVVKLQIFLYFCTLEIVPLLALWGSVEITANSLKINF